MYGISKIFSHFYPNNGKMICVSNKKKRKSNLLTTTKKTKKKERQPLYQGPTQTGSLKNQGGLRMVIGILGFALTFFGCLFYVYPRISIHPGETLDPSDPFKTPLVIKNDGYLPIRNIRYLMTDQTVELINNNHISGNTLDVYQEAINELKANRSTSIDIKRFISVPPSSIVSAEFVLDLKYKPCLIPYNFNERLRFKAERKVSGEYVWMEYYGPK
jgi:hypothetical protein